MMEGMPHVDSTENRLKVLQVVPSFYPAVEFGGPIFSTLAVCEGISRYPDVDVEVLTTDTARNSVGNRIQLSQRLVTFSNRFKVRYCRRTMLTSVSIELLFRLPNALRKAQVIHLTGPYSFPVIPTLLFAKILKKPVVWSPRGGFQATAQWDNSPNKHLKILFEKLCNIVRPRNTMMHVTAEVEACLSLSRFPGMRYQIIPNCVSVQENLPKKNWKKNNEINIVFLSRLHPKKGLEDLIDALTKLPRHFKLSVYGDGEESYKAYLLKKCVSSSLVDRVRFCGHVDGPEKEQAFLSADIFCLPTHSENFGIVIAEALAFGIPVVTTVHAPWQGILDHKCGKWVEVGADALASALSELAQENLEEIGCNGREWMQREFSQDSMARRFVDLYKKISGDNIEPGCW
jgi:glycosyltransferase involved in cell wall biosynthesis